MQNMVIMNAGIIGRHRSRQGWFQAREWDGPWCHSSWQEAKKGNRLGEEHDELNFKHAEFPLSFKKKSHLTLHKFILKFTHFT